jgi:thioredoxin reductase (NADPH)
VFWRILEKEKLKLFHNMSLETKTTHKEIKLLIVGAGPAGISLASEARVAGIDAKDIIMIDKAETHSWVIRSLYPDKKLVTANYKGMPAVCHGTMCLTDSSKDETISYLDRAIEKTGVTVNYREEVLKIEATGTTKEPFFKVETNKQKYWTKIVVIAIGIFGRPNKPHYKLPQKLKKSVYFDVTSFQATGEKILVVGGGDSASEFSQYLIEMGNNVTLSYRQQEFIRMNSFNLNALKELKKNNQIEILLESNVETVQVSENEKPLVSFKEAHLDATEYDKIVYALGGTTPNNFLKSTGINFENETPNLKESGESTIPGLFVIGDLLAGKKGGSIAHAFNASRATMKNICSNNYLDCKESW